MFATTGAANNLTCGGRVTTRPPRVSKKLIVRGEASSSDGTVAKTNKVALPSSVSLQRRTALLAAALAPLTLVTQPAFAAPAKKSPPTPEVSFGLLRTDIKGLMKKDGDFGPTMVRLAWHSSGTYDKMTKTGGNGGGTIRFKEELAHGGNAGLDKAVKRLEPLKKKHPEISWADLIAFVGVVAIETMGGPQINFSYGRFDEMDPAKVTPDGRLPDADKGDGPGPKTRKGLRDVFARMGFGDREIVALSGAHALGRCHAGTYLYFPYPGTLFAHTRLTLFVHNHRRVRVRRPVVRHAFAFQQLVLRASERA